MTKPVLIPNEFAKTYFTPIRIQAVQEFLTLPEEARVWVTEDFIVWEGYKIRGEFSENRILFDVSPSIDSPPVGIFEYGVDAFDTEIEAIQAAREALAEFLPSYISKGQYLAERERSLQQKGDT